MKKRLWTVRAAALGAALVFVTAVGVGVQAREPEELIEVTEISENVYQELKRNSGDSIKEKREVVGQALRIANMPENVIELLSDEFVRDVYSGGEMSLNVRYYIEKQDGTLKNIPREQYDRIQEYNQKIKSENLSLSNNMGIQPLSFESGEANGEISGLYHVLIGQTPDEDHTMSCMSIASWNTAPFMRLKDFIGIYTNNANVISQSAVVSLNYEKNYYNQHQVFSTNQEYYYNASEYIDNANGAGREVQLPINVADPNTSTEHNVSYNIQNLAIAMLIKIEPLSPQSEQNIRVVSDYYHRRLGLVSNIGISDNGIGFSATPTLCWSKSDVPINITYKP